jgi:hypothetical protein
MATQNDLIKRVNGWLHSIGSDGRYNRDRLFEQLGSGHRRTRGCSRPARLCQAARCAF